jgi:hypothetical protein
MTRIVRQYSSKITGQRRLYNEELDLLVLDWLANLIGNQLGKQLEMTEEPEKTFAQAGFNKAIENTVVLIEENV